MIDQTGLNNLNVDDKVEHFLIVAKIESKFTRANKEYLDLLLRDQTDQISAKLWGGFDEIKLTVSAGSLVKVRGVIEDYNGFRQLKINKIRLAEENDNVSVDDFLPKSHRNLDEMKAEFTALISSLNNSNLKILMQNLFSEERLKKYYRVPAGKAWHHAYIHGLLEHTLEIVKICELMCSFHSILDRDLLICGALLHDFGKTEELKDDASFDYTDKGKLIGHIVIAANAIETEAAKIPEFPEMLKNKLMHLVLSHQGKLEYATPVEPKLLEAIVLYQADELSAKTNAYLQAVKTDMNNESGWTRYLPLAGTALMIPEGNKNGANNLKESLFDK